MGVAVKSLFDAAARISTAWSLAAFAIAAVVSIILWKKGRIPKIAWAAIVAIVLLGLIPIIAPYFQTPAIYRVRVTVRDDHHLPRNDAKVTSSMGGEPKKVEGGWQFDIPAASLPGDGKMEIYAAIQSDFIKGSAPLQLDKDFNPNVTIQLEKDTSATVHGIVTDRSRRPVAGAHVGVVGFAPESIITKADGNFFLPAHAADGQQVELYAEKSGHPVTTQWCQAGHFPVTLVLD